MTFVKKPLAAGATLGDRLRALREDAGLTVEALGKNMSINPKHLLAIEESRYRDLPGLVYASQFVRRYAETMETDILMAMDIFEQEYAVVSRAKQNTRPLLTQRVNTDFHWTRRHARLIISILVIIVVVGYIGAQAIKNFVPPQLHVSQPNKDFSTKDLTIIVSGATDQNATVTINDQDVQTSGDGTFRETVDLRTGLNTLKISAIKKHSSARVIIRQVIVE